MRVEHTGDGVTRRPTVLKTVAVTGLHALPQLTIHTLAASATSRSCTVDLGRGNRSLRHANVSAFGIKKGKPQGRAARVLPQRLKPLLFATLFARLEAVRFHGGLENALARRTRRQRESNSVTAICVLGNQGVLGCRILWRRRRRPGPGDRNSASGGGRNSAGWRRCRTDGDLHDAVAHCV